jgi:hypothetical protein
VVTKQQAIEGSDFHYGTCRIMIGPSGGRNLAIEQWRRNGQTKLWKSRPDEFQVPIKWGLRGYGYLTQQNATLFHLASECKPVEESA